MATAWLQLKTRMHSSRMCTVRCSGRRGGGCLPGGVSVQGGLPGRGCLPEGSLPRGVSVQGRSCLSKGW